MKYIRSLQDFRQQYILGDAPVTIGRSSQNTIVLRENIVSRYHARIEAREPLAFLIDLNSTWGTFVNGSRIHHEHILVNGDLITIGSTQWQFFAEATSPAQEKPEPKAGYAFISYSRIDSKVIDTLILRLKKDGFRVWVDRAGIAGGDHWRQDIVDAIENCTVFILALSPHSIRSENVRKEVDLADSANRLILPIELQPITALPAKLKYQLAGIQRINLAGNFEAGFRQLVNAIESGSTPNVPPWKTSGQIIHKRSKSWLTLLFLVLIAFTCAALLLTFFQW